MDQVVNQACKIRYMFGGQRDFPIVVPGLLPERLALGRPTFPDRLRDVRAPGRAQDRAAVRASDALGLLKSAIRDNNPVVCFEPSRLDPVEEPVPDGDYLVPLGQAAVKRAGRDVTIVGLGYMVHEALEAADDLAAVGISVEVVDPRTLVPLDVETIRASVQKTGRLLVVDESPPTCSMAAEIAARSPRTAIPSGPCGSRFGGSARRRCRCPTARRWSRRRSPAETTSRPPCTRC